MNLKLQEITLFERAIIIAILIGFILGFCFSQVNAQGAPSKCEKVEQGVRNASNVTGAVACFPPGVIDIDLDDVVEDKTNTECVCRRSFEGSVQYWSFNKVDESIGVN